MIHPECVRQSITITIYPPLHLPELWTFEADVFGVWAVHEAPLDDKQKWYPWWHVTHVPSGALAVVAYEQQEALEAARRLAALEEPAVVVKESPREAQVAPLWCMAAARALDGIGVYAVRGDTAVPVGEMFRKAELEEKSVRESG